MGSPGERAHTLAVALRRHRRAAGLSQERLAEMSGVSVRTIRNIESGRVTTPRLASVTALADGLGVEGVERVRLNELCVNRDEQQARTGREGSIPVPLSPLVGRAAEVKALTDLLSSGTPRFVILTGVAGVGKTRLAMEVARQMRRSGRCAWWVPLAPIGDTRYVLDAVAGAVGASAASRSAVAGRLGTDPTLLALDNLEHLDGVGEVVVDLLDLSPATTVIATSRAPVGLPGEQEWLVRPLEVPAYDEVDAAALASVGSVELLVERVRAVVPGFELTPANSELIAELCRLLDGLPLAVELAAKQWRVRGGTGLVRSVRQDPLALHDIAGRAAPEHASLRSALEASYGLLGDAERHSMIRLSVFPPAGMSTRRLP